MEDVLMGLSGTMQNLSMSISNQGLGNVGGYIKLFDGDSKQFKDWIKQVEKYAMLNSFDDSNKIKVAFMTATGAASDYIFRWKEGTALQTWGDLKETLTKHFGDVAEPDHARALLRGMKQGVDESVSVYSGRMYNIAKDAFVDIDPTNAEAKRLIEQELIEFFVDGLKTDSVKYRIMRQSPSTFDEASRIALEEQNLRRRFEVRNGTPIREHYEGRHRNQERFQPTNNVEIPMDISHLRHNQCPKCLRKHQGPCHRSNVPFNGPRNYAPNHRSSEPFRFGQGQNRPDPNIRRTNSNARRNVTGRPNQFSGN